MLGVAVAQGASAAPKLPDFNYQCKLEQNGYPANGKFAMTFSLWMPPAAATRSARRSASPHGRS